MNVEIESGVYGCSICSLCRSTLYTIFGIPLLPPSMSQRNQPQNAVHSDSFRDTFVIVSSSAGAFRWKWKYCELENEINFHLMRKRTKIDSLWSYNLLIHGTHLLLCMLRRDVPFLHNFKASANQSNSTNDTVKQYLVFWMSLLALQISGFWCFQRYLWISYTEDANMWLCIEFGCGCWALPFFLPFLLVITI